MLIRLGECVSRIDRDDPGFVDAHIDLQLRRVKDSRNVVAHGDVVVDSELLWAILSTSIPRSPPGSPGSSADADRRVNSSSTRRVAPTNPCG
ncbi:HepT-like ribonuclease domain-containing protein [Isoptericola nanjingensis]